VIDEADNMFSRGMDWFLKEVIEKFGVPAKDKRQTMLFSATFPVEIQKLAAAYLFDHIWITIGAVGGASSMVQQTVMQVQHEEKFEKLLWVLHDFLEKRKGGDRLIVFCNGKQQVKWLDEKLYKASFDVCALHGDLSQMDREDNLHRFRSGLIDILVATDIASRGLDIGGVTQVVNYDLPRQTSNSSGIDVYVQRIGRTGRIGHVGRAVSFITMSRCGQFLDHETVLLELAPKMRDARSEVPDWLQRHVDSVKHSQGSCEFSC
jgi:superfamily II DNA/RNA helicase